MRAKRFTLGLVLAALLLVGAVPSLGLFGNVAGAAPGQPDCIYAEDGACVAGPVSPDQLASRPAPPAISARVGERVLVKRGAGVSPSTFKDKLDKEGLAGAEGLLVPGWWAVPVPPGRTADDVLAQVKRLPETVSAEREVERTIFATPNDPLYPLYQWGPPKIGAPAAWDLTFGSTGVLLAVVDTGIDTAHQDRPAHLLLGPDFANGDLNPYDDHGHGTHVSGIAAAATNNATGVAGICPGCTLLAVKVMLGSGVGTDTAIAQGIRYAADTGVTQSKRTIINLSIGGDYSPIEADAVAYAQGKGALVVAAAGNGGHKAPSYPAALPGVLPVAATDAYDQIAYYSQYAPLGLAAPGGGFQVTTGPDILSTVPGGYIEMAGTSMASPHAAGAAGLLLSQFPACTATQVATELRATVDVPGFWNFSYGTGRLNVDKAILRITSAVLPDPVQWLPYEAVLGIAGGSGSKCFSVVGGALPVGMVVKANGTVSGTPTEFGAFTFTVKVSDGICETAERSFTFTVSENPLVRGANKVFLPLVANPTVAVEDVCR